MTPQSSCKYNGHGFNSDGICIYCHEDDGTQTNANDPWAEAKTFNFMGYEIVVLKATKESSRRFYAELHQRNGSYLASMGSDMPTYTLTMLETYFKRKTLLK